MKYHFPLKKLAIDSNVSERRLAVDARLSRTCIRALKSASSSLTLSSIERAAAVFDREITVLATPNSQRSDFSSVATAFKIDRDGFESWRIHLMDFVDEFRRSLDPRLLVLKPMSTTNARIFALIASVTVSLAEEAEMAAPQWASQSYFLDAPWFVSEMESLKASAIQESPLAFRRNNIFVQANFLARA